MNLRQMVARIMRALPSVQPGSIGELDVVDMLNQGQQDLARMSLMVEEESNTIAANANEADLPSDLLLLHAVYWTAHSRKRELYPAKEQIPVGDSTIKAEPVMYYVLKDKVRIRPTPGYSGALSITYIPKPTALLNDTDEVSLPGCEEYLIAFALHNFHLEHSSPMMQVWDVRRAKAEKEWLATYNQQYETPMQVDLQW